MCAQEKTSKFATTDRERRILLNSRKCRTLNSSVFVICGHKHPQNASAGWNGRNFILYHTYVFTVRNTLPASIAFEYGARFKVGNGKKLAMGRIVESDSVEDDQEV